MINKFLAFYGTQFIAVFKPACYWITSWSNTHHQTLHFKIALPSTSRSLKRYLLSRFRIKYLLSFLISLVHATCCIPNNIRRRVKNTKLLIILLPLSCHFMFLKFKYSPQHWNYKTNFYTLNARTRKSPLTWMDPTVFHVNTYGVIFCCL